MDFLLFPGGILGIVVCLFLYLRKSQEGQRALKIAKTNLSPAEDIVRGYASVASSMRALRQAKQEEHQLLLRNWQNSYIELLPDTDPEKITHNARLQGVKVEEAKFVLDNAGRMMPLVEDGPEWVPLPYTKGDPDEGLTYTDRRIQRAGAFVRSEPNTKASTYGVADGGSIVHFDGYVYGEAVAGNDIWFVYIGEGSGLRKYVHSIATTNRSTTGLPDMTYATSTADYTINPHVPMPDQEKEKQQTLAIVKKYHEGRRSKNVTRM